MVCTVFSYLKIAPLNAWPHAWFLLTSKNTCDTCCICPVLCIDTTTIYGEPNGIIHYSVTYKFTWMHSSCIYTFSSAGFVIVVFSNHYDAILCLCCCCRNIAESVFYTLKIQTMQQTRQGRHDGIKSTWAFLKIGLNIEWILDPGGGITFLEFEYVFAWVVLGEKKPQASKPQLLSYSNYVFDLIT